MKSSPLTFLLIACVFISCSERNSSEESNFVDVTDILEIELDTLSIITQTKYDFTNTTNQQPVSVIHHLDQTAFHSYNSIAFKTQQVGALAGGTALRIRITQDGGENWKQFGFSRFSNAFFSVAFLGNTLFVVGESKYVFRTDNLGDTWTVFNTESFFEPKPLTQLQYSKVRFLNDTLGYISGQRNSQPALLKTTNGGNDWVNLEMQGLSDKESFISDFKIQSAQEILIVTASGRCYQSMDSGVNWKLRYESGDETASLNSIDFKNATTGLIGGLNNLLLYTDDGGQQWHEIELPVDSDRINVSDILFVKEQALITTALSFGDEERAVFVFTLDEEKMEVQPFLTKKDSAVFFVGDSYGVGSLDHDVLILDRNNLYKTTAAKP